MAKKKLIAAASLLLPAVLCAAGYEDRGMRFDSAGVVDLSARPLKLSNKQAIATAPLTDEEAKAILAAAALNEDNPSLPFSETLFGCKEDSTDCAKAAERTQIDTNSRRVARNGKQLVVTPVEGAAATFLDWTLPETKTADGDAETHYYLGRLVGSGYHRVEVRFGHDAPGSFLINPKNGKVVFVHNGGDIVAVSQAGWHIADFAAEDIQHPLRVAALDESGPRVELQCASASTGDKTEVQLKGWHDPFTLDLQLDTPAHAGQPAAHLALRLKRAPAGTWTAATTDAARLAASGFRCE
jgi:hypothetical protein